MLNFIRPQLTLKYQTKMQLFILIFIGLLIFLTLKLHPAVGQLFSRGSDFLFSLSDLLAGRTWSNTWGNLWRFFFYLAQYLTPHLMILVGVGLFLDRTRRKVAGLLLATIVFLAPMILLGKVVYPRYLLPK
jgi:hypothetical protein